MNIARGCVVVGVILALSITRLSLAAPATGPSTSPAVEAPAIARAALAPIGRATQLRLVLEQRQTLEPIDHKDDPEIMGEAWDGSITIQLRRTNAFRLNSSVFSDRCLLFDGATLYRLFGKHGRNISTALPGVTAERVLLQRSAGFLDQRIAQLLRNDLVDLAAGPIADARRVGLMMDGERIVARIELGRIDGERWELWAEPQPPHALRRIIVTGEETMGYMFGSPGDPNARREFVRMSARREWVVRECDVDAKFADDAFAAPKVEMTAEREPAGPDDFVGKPLPAFAAHDLAGHPIRSQDLRGKVTVLDFWFIGCAPCREFMPAVHDLAIKCGVDFYAVNHEDPPDQIAAALRDRGWDGWPMVVDDQQQLTHALQVRSFPTVIVVGRDGRIAWVDPVHDDLSRAAFARVLKDLAAKN